VLIKAALLNDMSCVVVVVVSAVLRGDGAGQVVESSASAAGG